VLVASLHLAYPEQEEFSFAEMALWGCFIVDSLTMKIAFRDVKGMGKSLPRQTEL
jgi:hypothetical protein